jgi:hypothetical protein
MFRTIECESRAVGVGKQLSNLMPYRFKLDDLECASMEGFLQSIKFSDPVMSTTLRAMHGVAAFKKGQEGNDWKFKQILFWNGSSYPRTSLSYKLLIERAYDALFDQNVMYRDALRITNDAVLTHKIGKTDQTDTTLTQVEYLYNLYRLRAKALQGL